MLTRSQLMEFPSEKIHETLSKMTNAEVDTFKKTCMPYLEQFEQLFMIKAELTERDWLGKVCNTLKARHPELFNTPARPSTPSSPGSTEAPARAGSTAAPARTVGAAPGGAVAAEGGAEVAAKGAAVDAVSRTTGAEHGGTAA